MFQKHIYIRLNYVGNSMKNKNKIRLVTNLLLIGVLSSVSAAPEPGGYKISAGDILSISVWKEPDLTKDVIVRPDGGISFPLVGNVIAAGRTIDELQKIIGSNLVRYIPDPVITIAMKSLGGNRVYIIGKVNKPGVYPMSQNTDVMQALSMAGGLTPYASTGSIKILRHEGEQQKVFLFDYSEVEDGEKLEQNRNLLSGDTVIVP